MSGYPVKRVIAFSLLVSVIALLIPSSVSCSKPPAPTAAFTVSYVNGERLLEDPIAGTAPLTVQFTDQSSGKITSWRWNLGDGTVVEGSDEGSRNFTHEYKNANSSGYTVTLKVQGPGGKDEKEESGIVTVFSCSEAANVELNEAKLAIQGCLSAAGKTALDAPAPAWDGSRGKVIADGRDATDYLGVWKTFKATYAVKLDGTIESGTDVSWGCIKWTVSITGPRWGAK